MTATRTRVRLAEYAHGGGCACKTPPGELEAAVAGLLAGRPARPAVELVVGLDDGDDGEIPGHPVVGELVPRGPRLVVVR
jgi:selenide,water dikinase